MPCASSPRAASSSHASNVGPASVAPGGQPFSVMGFTVVGGRIVEIDAITDPERLRELDLAVLDD